MATISKEDAFADLVRPYENMWVAIIEEDGVEYIVGHGSTAVEAANEATDKGYPQPQATLFRVPPFSTPPNSRFIF
jgi:hypothetical protein